MMYGWGDMGGWGWLGMFLMLVFWFGLIALLISAVSGVGQNRTTRQVDGPTGSDPALAILRERYARGEIEADEYGRARQALETGKR